MYVKIIVYIVHTELELHVHVHVLYIYHVHVHMYIPVYLFCALSISTYNQEHISHLITALQVTHKLQLHCIFAPSLLSCLDGIRCTM